MASTLYDIPENFTSLPPDWYVSLPLWSELSGVKVDGFSFSFHGHNYLFPLFLDRSPQIVWMKSAQMGATIWMVLRAIHQAMYPDAWGFDMPIKVGFYFPGEDGLNLLVKGRIEPLLRSTELLKPYAKEQSRTWKPFGESSMYFLYIGGKSAKDSTPMMSEFFDEVRLMDLRDIEQAEERVSHSPIKYIQKVSTAGIPEDDIHALFLNSDQKWWTTICERCGCEQIMCLEFPDCVADHTWGTKKGQTYYKCKKCGEKINDTQHGRYIPHGDPNHDVSGYQISQLISHRITPKELWFKFRNMTDKAEFWNSKLGMPFVDAENRPVTMEMLPNNVSPLLEWGQTHGGPLCMGIDQMAGLNYIFIGTRSSTSQEYKIIWFEIVESRSPFERAAELMEDYSVQLCVCELEPNANDALKFADRFGKRVFLAKYGEYDHMVRWEDHWRPGKGQRRADPETYHQYRVFIDKYKSVERTLTLLAKEQIRWPDPMQRVQVATDIKGSVKTSFPIMESHAYPMFSCPVKQKVEVDKEGKKFKYKWNFIGMDPHALCALDFMVRACEKRLRMGSLFSY